MSQPIHSLIVLERPLRMLGALLSSALIVACGDLNLSPRQEVVRAANKALCEKLDIRAMIPFVTESSQPLLNLAGSFAELGKVLGENSADRMAVECQTGKGFDFAQEVKVSEARYVVRTKSRATGEITEYVVVLESGKWKIALTGK